MMKKLFMFNTRLLSRALAFVCALSFAVPTLPMQESLMGRLKNVSLDVLSHTRDYLYDKRRDLVVTAIMIFGPHILDKIYRKIDEYKTRKRQQSEQKERERQMQLLLAEQSRQQLLRDQEYAKRRQYLEMEEQGFFDDPYELNVYLAITIKLLDERMKSCMAQGLPNNDVVDELFDIMYLRNFDATVYKIERIKNKKLTCQVIVPGEKEYVESCVYNFNYAVIANPTWKKIVQRALFVLEQDQHNMLAQYAVGFSCAPLNG